MTTPHVSVIIPTYRRRALVERALTALAEQTAAPAAYEVVVSIDGSEDGTRELVADLDVPYQLTALWQPNRGRAAACNAGAQAARGEIVVFLDDDMEPPPTFVEAHRQAHVGQPALGIIGPVPVVGRQRRVSQYIASRFDQHLAKIGQPEHRMRLRDFYSGNFSIRRETFWSVGGFDEAFRIYGNEDLELALRLTQAGVRLLVAPEALAYQHYTKSFADLAGDTISKGRTAVLLAQMHPEAVGQLRFSTDEYGSRSWKLTRTLLLRLSRAWGVTPRLVMSVVWALTEGAPRRFDLCYTLALDYFYWLGVEAARREYRMADHLYGARQAPGSVP